MEWETTTEGGSPERVSGVSRSPRSEAERVTEPGAPWAAQGAMPQGGAASVSSVDPPSLFLRLFVLFVAKSQSTLLAAMGRR